MVQNADDKHQNDDDGGGSGGFGQLYFSQHIALIPFLTAFKYVKICYRKSWGLLFILWWEGWFQKFTAGGYGCMNSLLDFISLDTIS